MRGTRAPLIVLGIVALTAACNSIVGYGDFTKASPESNSGNGDDDTDGTSSSGKVGSSSSGDAGGSSSGQSGSSGVTPPIPVDNGCDQTKDWNPPVAVANVNNGGSFNGNATLTADELAMVFQRSNSGNDGQIMRATRASKTADFGTPAVMTELVQIGHDISPSIRNDGLFIYWAEVVEGSGSSARRAIMRAGRTTATGTFEDPAPFQPTTSATANDEQPYATADAKEVYFSRSTTGASRIFRITSTGDDQWTAPAEVTELRATNSAEVHVALSTDGLTMFFASDRKKTNDYDIYTAKRPNLTSPFANITPLTSLNTTGAADVPTWLSPDNCRLYITRETQIMVATRKD